MVPVTELSPTRTTTVKLTKCSLGGKVTLIINGWDACCASPDSITICTRIYTELMLFFCFVRWLHEILKPNETTDTHNSINNQFMTTYESFIYSSQKELFTQHTRCCPGQISASLTTYPGVIVSNLICP